MNKTHFKFNRFYGEQTFCLDDMTDEQLGYLTRLAIQGLQIKAKGVYSWDSELGIERVADPETQRIIDQQERIEVEEKKRIDELVKAAIAEFIPAKKDTDNA